MCARLSLQVEGPRPLSRSDRNAKVGRLFRRCKIEEWPLFAFTAMQAAVISFVQPTTTRKLSYRDQHNQLHAALSDHPIFHDGHILDTLERGGLPLSSCFRPAAILRLQKFSNTISSFKYVFLFHYSGPPSASY